MGTDRTPTTLSIVSFGRGAKSMPLLPQRIGLSTALSVIQRNVGSVGIVQVLAEMAINRNAVSLRLLERLDRTKET